MPNRCILLSRGNSMLSSDFVVSKYILEGDLSPRDRAIYDALLVANDGRHEEVGGLLHPEDPVLGTERRHGDPMQAQRLELL